MLTAFVLYIPFTEYNQFELPVSQRITPEIVFVTVFAYCYISNILFSGELSTNMYRTGALFQITQIRKMTLTAWPVVPQLSSYLCDELCREQCSTYRKQQSRRFKDFGHKPQPEPFRSKLWYTFVVFIFIGSTVNWKG
jgi:hypothetical protein